MSLNWFLSLLLCLLVLDATVHFSPVRGQALQVDTWLYLSSYFDSTHLLKGSGTAAASLATEEKANVKQTCEDMKPSKFATSISPASDPHAFQIDVAGSPRITKDVTLQVTVSITSATSVTAFLIQARNAKYNEYNPTKSLFDATINPNVYFGKFSKLLQTVSVASTLPAVYVNGTGTANATNATISTNATVNAKPNDFVLLKCGTQEADTGAFVTLDTNDHRRSVTVEWKATGWPFYSPLSNGSKEAVSGIVFVATAFSIQSFTRANPPGFVGGTYVIQARSAPVYLATSGSGALVFGYGHEHFFLVLWAALGALFVGYFRRE